MKTREEKISLSERFEKQMKEFQTNPEFVAISLLNGITEKFSIKLDELNLSKKNLAKKLNVSSAYISKLMNGNPNLTIKSLVKISMCLDLKPKIEFEEISSSIKLKSCLLSMFNRADENEFKWRFGYNNFPRGDFNNDRFEVA